MTLSTPAASIASHRFTVPSMFTATSADMGAE